MPSAYLTFLHHLSDAASVRLEKKVVLQNIPLPRIVKVPARALVGAFGVREPVLLINQMYRKGADAPVIPIRVEVTLSSQNPARIKIRDLDNLEIWNLKRFQKDAMQSLLARAQLGVKEGADTRVEMVSAQLDALTQAARAISLNAKLLVTSIWTGERRMDVGVLLRRDGVTIEGGGTFDLPEWLPSY